ncbi:MAG: class I SAM-dependent methyltransferase [Bacteroidota bacterium]
MSVQSYDDLPLWSAPFGLTLLDTVRTKSHISILDIGSGSGFPMLELAERLGKTCMVYGLDPSPESIAMIHEKLALKEIGNAKIIEGVAEAIPFPDEYFGLIVSNNGLNNVSDQVAAFAECFRVAAPGAQMVLTMNLPHTMVEFYDVFEETLVELGFSEEIRKMKKHITAKRKTVEYLKELILETGFIINTINVDGFKMRYSDGTAFLNHSFIRAAFMPSWRELLPGNQADMIFRGLERKLNLFATEKGELPISIPFVCFDCLKPGQ